MDVTGTYYFYLLCQHTDSVADSKKMVIFLQVSLPTYKYPTIVLGTFNNL